MREGKPYAKLLLHAAQILILFSLIQAVGNHTWYTGVVDIKYTEGLPEGSGLEVELEVDQKSADGSIHIDGFFTYMQWQNTRNDTTIPDNSTDDDKDSDSMEFKPLSEIQEELPLLTKVAFSLGIILLFLAFFNIRYRAILGIALNGLVLWICITLVVFAPLGYIGGMDFGTGSFESESTTSTVHESSEGGLVFDAINGELEYEFKTEGYDLGLVDESEFDSVVAKAPGKDHRSYTEMDGVAGIHYSPFVVELVWAWLVLFTITPMTIAFIGRVRIEKPQLV